MGPLARGHRAAGGEGLGPRSLSVLPELKDLASAVRLVFAGLGRWDPGRGREEVSFDCLSPWIPDRPDSECVMLWELWGAGGVGAAVVVGGEAVCGWIGNPAWQCQPQQETPLLIRQAVGQRAAVLGALPQARMVSKGRG